MANKWRMKWLQWARDYDAAYDKEDFLLQIADPVEDLAVLEEGLKMTNEMKERIAQERDTAE